MFYAGRYLIVLMGIFSIYQGFLYNEFFSLPMNFGSMWRLITNETQPGASYNNFEIPGYPGGEYMAYPFGVDPIWKGASNELLYYNSVKMKMSIIIGVIQMSLGIFLHLLNAIHFRNWIDIISEFLPRIIFLWAIFGYLCFMIFFKWGTDYGSQDLYNFEWANQNNISATELPPYPGTAGAPVLLNELIFMILPGGKSDNLFKGQSVLQTFLVVLALLMIPIMACLKPCYFKCRPKAPKKTKLEDDPIELIDEDYHLYNAAPAHQEEEFSELMVHQLLETIEFVLGSVSHTASYLRLWALSLAHSELATVFWNKVVFLLMSNASTIQSDSAWFITALAMFAAFSIWFFITFLVMMFMEGLSAFLHALRLHWVEFQSKFYKGDGHEFMPFDYSRLDTPQTS